MRWSRAAFMPASKYSASPGAARSWATPVPTAVVPRGVHALVGSDEGAAIFAAALAGPLQRHLDDALGAFDVRDRARVVDLDERRVHDVRGERHGFAGLDPIGAGVRLDVIGNTVDEPAHQLTP